MIYTAPYPTVQIILSRYHSQHPGALRADGRATLRTDRDVVWSTDRPVPLGVAQ